MKKKHLLTIIAIVVIIASLLAYILVGLTVSDDLILENINLVINKNGTDIKVVQISDLHIGYTKIDFDELKNAVLKAKPDLIFFTGDMIDFRSTKDDINNLNNFFAAFKNICEMYSVNGNHELINDNLKYYNKILSDNKITLLQNKAVSTTVKGINLTIVGVDDKEIYSYENVESLKDMTNNSPVLLLAHRPEKWNEYLSSTDNHKPVATFSGHNHGGQAQIFGIGLYSPATGLFPKYYDGLYKNNKNQSLIVSRGLGDSKFPYRFYCSYHLPIVSLIIGEPNP